MHAQYVTISSGHPVRFSGIALGRNQLNLFVPACARGVFVATCTSVYTLVNMNLIIKGVHDIYSQSRHQGGGGGGGAVVTPPPKVGGYFHHSSGYKSTLPEIFCASHQILIQNRMIM